MTFQLQSPQQHVIDLNIQILDALFHIPSYRRTFWNTPHAIDSLVSILKKSSAPQKVYELTFAIWLLSFDDEVAKNLDRKCHVISTLVDFAKSAVKEKVIRVIMATFRVSECFIKKNQSNDSTNKKNRTLLKKLLLKICRPCW